MNKYKVKEGRRVVHAGEEYLAQSFVELDPEIAIFHAASLELVKEPKPAISKEKTDAGKP